MSSGGAEGDEEGARELARPKPLSRRGRAASAPPLSRREQRLSSRCVESPASSAGRFSFGSQPSLPPGTPPGEATERDRSPAIQLLDGDNSPEALQLQACLRTERQRTGHVGWYSLGYLFKKYKRLSKFDFDDLWTVAVLACDRGTRRFDCYWERGSHRGVSGNWLVYVRLRARYQFSYHEGGWPRD